MTMVEGGELRFVESLDHGEDGSVNKAKREIAVAVEQLAHAAIVVQFHIEDPQPASVDVGQEAQKGLGLEALSRKPIYLDKNGRRDNHFLIDRLQEACTRIMVPVGAIHRRIEGSRVAD